jgi:hypothetical protein
MKGGYLVHGITSTASRFAGVIGDNSHGRQEWCATVSNPAVREYGSVHEGERLARVALCAEGAWTI